MMDGRGSIYFLLMPASPFVVLIATISSATATQDSVCIEPRAQLATAIALFTSLETPFGEARQNVIANELQLRNCESGTKVPQHSTEVVRRTSGQDKFSCNSAWETRNAVVKCGTFGGKDAAIEVADAGGWTHAYQEIAVVPDGIYQLTGEFYPIAAGECDGSVAVTWCSPSVVVCPGPYNGDYYTTGGCYVGIAPSPTSKDAWEPFEATFTTAVDVVTVYINQESTTYSSIVNAVRIFLLKERL